MFKNGAALRVCNGLRWAWVAPLSLGLFLSSAPCFAQDENDAPTPDVVPDAPAPQASPADSAPPPEAQAGWSPQLHLQPPPAPVPDPRVYIAVSPKSAAGAFVLEWLLPGAGNLYTDNGTAVLTTYMLMAAGVLGIVLAVRDNAPESDDFRRATALTGVGLLVGGRIYGLVEAVSSARSEQTVVVQESRWRP